MPIVMVVGAIAFAVIVLVGMLGTAGFYVWRQAQNAQAARVAQRRAFQDDTNRRARQEEWRERDEIMRRERDEMMRRERERAEEQDQKNREQWEAEQAERDRDA
jgi:uncharacterized protein HemX